MKSSFWIGLIVIGVVLVGVAIIAARRVRQHNRRSLQDRFLSEYDRTVRIARDRDAAEHELQHRLDRRNVVQLHDIDARRRDAIRNEWISTQLTFVDNPTRALTRAARLVHCAMSERGYPGENAAEQIDLVSVDYPELVTDFRRAHLATLRGRSGSADTEELRQAFRRYRVVFDRLLDASEPADASHR